MIVVSERMTMFTHDALPTPHGDKLSKLLNNTKLPPADRTNVEEAQQRYATWRSNSLDITNRSETAAVEKLVQELNDYKHWVDVRLIFDSREDFLYRQRGQLKIDNSILEEFLPILVAAGLSNLVNDDSLSLGPARSFSGIVFESDLRSLSNGGGMRFRSKDQDFAISRPLYINASHHADMSNSTTSDTNIPYVAAEIKTNLDKTMFQEATATAADMKSMVPSSKYYLIAEWLDMTPISTSVTPIDEVFLLRHGKRISSSQRSRFSTTEGRRQSRSGYIKHLMDHPLSPVPFERLIQNIVSLFMELDEEAVLERGWF